MREAFLGPRVDSHFYLRIIAASSSSLVLTAALHGSLKLLCLTRT